MQTYWAIKWKSYNVEDLLLNDKQKEYVENEWIKPAEKRQKQTFTLNGETYSFNSIDSITKTKIKIEPDTKLLYASEEAQQDKGPLINDEGDVVTEWRKKLVSISEYEKYFSKAPGYYLISKEQGGMYVGLRWAVRVNGDIPDYLELCTEEEAERLWKFLLHQ